MPTEKQKQETKRALGKLILACAVGETQFALSVANIADNNVALAQRLVKSLGGINNEAGILWHVEAIIKERLAE